MTIIYSYDDTVIYRKFSICLTASSLVNGKNADRNESELKKSAFGDIKNALSTPQVSEGGKTISKAFELPKTECAPEYASSRPVDMYDFMVDKLTFTDEEVNKWAKCINLGWMDTYDDIKPPPPITDFDLSELLMPICSE